MVTLDLMRLLPGRRMAGDSPHLTSAAKGRGPVEGFLFMRLHLCIWEGKPSPEDCPVTPPLAVTGKAGRKGT